MRVVFVIKISLLNRCFNFFSVLKNSVFVKEWFLL
nr:MAG TPA: hypothetical protein [Caudoviricetes sp.]